MIEGTASIGNLLSSVCVSLLLLNVQGLRHEVIVGHVTIRVVSHISHSSSIYRQSGMHGITHCTSMTTLILFVAHSVCTT